MTDRDPEEKAAAEEAEVQAAPVEQEEAQNQSSSEQRLLEERDRYLRLYADFENYKKRSAKEKTDIYTYAVVPLIEKLLGVLDSFDLALAKPAQDAAMMEGFRLIHRQFKEALSAEGLEPLAAVGEMFNPAMHHALASASSEDAKDGAVLEEFIAGYKFKDKIIRPAMVKVNKLDSSKEQEE